MLPDRYTNETNFDCPYNYMYHHIVGKLVTICSIICLSDIRRRFSLIDIYARDNISMNAICDLMFIVASQFLFLSSTDCKLGECL